MNGRSCDDRVALVGSIAVFEHSDGHWVEVARGRNVVVNQFYIDLFATISGSAGPALAMSVLSVGTGTLPTSGTPAVPTTARTDVAMVNEWKRYSQVSSQAANSDPPNVTLSFFLPASDGAVSITEVGLFSHGATLTAGTGLMAAHSPLTYAKSGTNDARLDWTLGRALT